MSSYTQSCAVHYKYLIKQYQDLDNNLDTVDYTWYYDKEWQEMKPETDVSISQDNFLLLKIEIPASIALNENYDYLRDAHLSFNIPTPHSLFMRQLNENEWSDKKEANELLNILDLPNESTNGWDRFSDLILLGGSGSPVPTGYVYMVLSGGLYSEDNNSYLSDTGLEISYIETFEYPALSVSLSVVDNYNNTFKVTIKPKEYNYTLSEGETLAITHTINYRYDSETSLEIYADTIEANDFSECSESYSLAIQNKSEATRSVYVNSSTTFTVTDKDGNKIIEESVENNNVSAEIKQYAAPTFPVNTKPVLVTEQLSLDTDWTFEWPAAEATNSSSPVKGYLINLNDNVNSAYSKLLKHSAEKDKYSYTFKPSSLDLVTGDTIWLKVRAYTQFGENNDNNNISSNTIITRIDSDKYIISSQETGIINIKNSEGNWIAGEVYIKTDGVWANTTVYIKTAEGWKASIE